MTETRKPFFYDVTLRDGNQALPKPWNNAQKKDVYLLLLKLGVQGAEVGFPASSEMDFESVMELAKLTAQMAEEGDFSFVRDASETITFLPEIKLDPKQTQDIKFGRKIAFPFEVALEGDERIYYRATSEGKLIAVVFPAVENGILTMRIERLYAHD